MVERPGGQDIFKPQGNRSEVPIDTLSNILIDKLLYLVIPKEGTR